MVLSVAMGNMLFKQRSWNSFRSERPPLVPDSFCVTCFLEGTRFPLQSACLGERPTLLDVSVEISRACFSGCNG